MYPGGVPSSGSERGQTATLGITLVFAVMIGGIAVVVATGAGAIAETEGQLTIDRAETAMTQMDSRIAQVAIGASGSQTVDLASASDSGYAVREDAGSIEVSTASASDAVLEADLGAVVYERDRTKLAYQGGGVWKRSPGGGSTMVSPPEFHYRDETLTLPMVLVRGSASFDSRARVDEVRNQRNYPDPGESLTNPIDSGLVTVTVTSEYYEAWGRYFEERTDGEIEYDHDERKATLELTNPREDPEVGGGIISGAGTEIKLMPGVTIDGYDSRDGPHSDSRGKDADIYTSTDLRLQPGVEIEGTVVTDKDLEMRPRSTIHGDARVGGESDTAKGEIEGDIYHSADVPQVDSAGGLIEDRKEMYSSSNDNSDRSSTISDIESGNCPLESDSDRCELPSGNYHLNEIDLRGIGDANRELVLDTTGGDINIVVDGDIDVGWIEVKGENRVNVYAEGDFVMNNAYPSAIKNQDDGNDATQFWLYMNHHKTATIESRESNKFVGVIYGPGPDSTPGVEVTLENQVEVFGAVVGDLNKIKATHDEGGVLHYDQALVESSATEDGTTLPALTYLHVSSNEVRIEG